MILYLLLAFFIGGFLGVLAMAICKSRAKADYIQEIYYLKGLLRKILDWYKKGMENKYRRDKWDVLADVVEWKTKFPEQEIQEALKEQ